jgi:hypothetical protein
MIALPLAFRRAVKRESGGAVTLLGRPMSADGAQHTLSHARA